MIVGVDRDELWRHLAQRPHAVRFQELQRLLPLSGLTLDRVRGSHHVYRRGQMLAAYVRDVYRRTREGLGDG